MKKFFSIICFFIIATNIPTHFCRNEGTILCTGNDVPQGYMDKVVRADFFLVDSNCEDNSVRFIGKGTVLRSIIFESGNDVEEYIYSFPNCDDYLENEKKIEWYRAEKGMQKYLVYGRVKEKNGNNYGAETSEFDNKDKLHVNGSKIYNENDEIVIINGVCTVDPYNMIKTKWPRWYNEYSLSSLKEWGINALRITVTTDKFVNGSCSSIEAFEEYIDLCINNQVYAIVCWAANTNLVDYSEAACDFFNQISEDYSDSPYVLYEIANEPFNVEWNDIKRYSEMVIRVIQAKNPDALIFVPAPYAIDMSDRSYMIDCILESPIQYNNVVYTTHIYVGSKLHYGNLSKISELLKSGYPVVITEWSTTRADGIQGYYEEYANTLWDFMKKNDVGWVYYQLSDFSTTNHPEYKGSISRPGEWDNALSDDSLSDGGKYLKHRMLGDYSGKDSCVMMNYTPNFAFWKNEYRSIINQIYFKNDSFLPNNEIIQIWDVSMNPNSGEVLSYLVIDENGKYILYVVAKNGSVILPPSIDNMFSNFSNVERFSFENCISSYSNYTNMLFYGCTRLKSIDLTCFDTSELSTFSCMFANCTSLESIDLSNCDLSNIDSMTYAFANCKSLKKIIFPKMDVEAISFTAAFNGTDYVELVGYYEDIIRIENIFPEKHFLNSGY